MKTIFRKSNTNSGIIAILLFATSANISAQNDGLLAFNSDKKRVKVENKLASLTNEMEKTVRYKAPIVENTAESTSEIPNVTLEDVKELRSWIEVNLEKEITNCNFEAKGNATLTLLINKYGQIIDVKIENNDKQIDKLLLKVLKKAPKVKPVSMNGYSAKQLIQLPINYRIEQL